MSAPTYTLPVLPAIFSHGQTDVLLLGDFDEVSNTDGRTFNVADAMAASGDYFATLATRLDKLAQGLPYDSSEQIELEHIVQTLFYLQDNWTLVAKYKR